MHRLRTYFSVWTWSLLMIIHSDLFMCHQLRADVKGVKITTDQTIDSSSLETIVQQAIQRAQAKTNDEKAIAIYEYLHNTIFHWAYPVESAPQSVGPLKIINVYGWGLCGGQHTVLKALFETAGWECRYVGWPGHTTIEVKYDNRWHYFDVFLKCYYWSKDKTHIVSQEEIAKDPSIVLDAMKENRAARQNLCCGDAPQDVIQGCQHRHIEGNAKGWASVTWRDQDYQPLVHLPLHSSLTLAWKGDPFGFAVSGKPPQHSCGIKDFIHDKVLGPRLEHYGPRNWSNGTFLYQVHFQPDQPFDYLEFQNAMVTQHGLTVQDPNKNNGKGVLILQLPSAYPFVSVNISTDSNRKDDVIAVSTNRGKSWQLCRWEDISKLAKQKYHLSFKLEFQGNIQNLQLKAQVEHNRNALPYLIPGKNKITVSCNNNKLPDNSKLVVTYRYQESNIANPQKRSRWDGKGIQYGPIKTVSREVNRLPYKFEIDVGGNAPPKMIDLTRELKAVSK